MDASRFDQLTRLISGARSRRRVLAAVALGTIGISAMQAESVAGPGCTNVGGKCKNAGQCCSGVCKGKKGKKRCKAHDANGCRAGQRFGPCGGAGDVDCTTSAGRTGVCNTTTGNAGFCTAVGGCTPCTRDADCQPFCGPQAACILCDNCIDTGGTSCVGPDACDFT